jgi:hypothetical protein
MGVGVSAPGSIVRREGCEPGSLLFTAICDYPEQAGLYDVRRVLLADSPRGPARRGPGSPMRFALSMFVVP